MKKLIASIIVSLMVTAPLSANALVTGTGSSSTNFYLNRYLVCQQHADDPVFQNKHNCDGSRDWLVAPIGLGLGIVLLGCVVGVVKLVDWRDAKKARRCH